MIVIVDEVMAAFRSAWPTTGALSGVPLVAHDAPPDQTSDTCAVIQVSETGRPDVESDGLAQQQFRVEIAVYTRRNPPPSASAMAALVLLYDGTPSAPGAGLTLTTGKKVTLVTPNSSTLRRLPGRRGGLDVIAASRVWDVTTNARQGA